MVRDAIYIQNVSEIYDRCFYSQLHDYFDKNIFSKSQCGFRKGFSTQHAFVVKIKKMKTPCDKKRIARLSPQIF